MTVKLLTQRHLESLSLKEGCTGWSESTLVKMSHCWKSHVLKQLKGYTKISGSQAATKLGVNLRLYFTVHIYS